MNKYDGGTKQQAHTAQLAVKYTGETNLLQNNQQNRNWHTVLECKDWISDTQAWLTGHKVLQQGSAVRHWKLTTGSHVSNIQASSCGYEKTVPT